MAVDRREMKKSKDFAEKLLAVKGINYDEWLHEQHLSVKDTHSELLDEALDLLIQKNKKPFLNTENK